MRSFICNELEPIAYLLYVLAVYIKYHQHRQHRLLVLMVFYALAAILLYTGIIITSILNNWSYNLLFILQILVLSWYYHFLITGYRKRLFIVASIVLNTAMFVYFDIVQQTFFSMFNSIVYGISFISVVVYSLFYLHQLLADVKDENILLNFDFWLISGYLVYFLGSFIIVIYYENADVMRRGNMWAMQNIILTLCAIVSLLAGISIAHKKKLQHG